MGQRSTRSSPKRSRGGLLRRLAKTAKRAQIAKTGFSWPSGANPVGQIRPKLATKLSLMLAGRWDGENLPERVRSLALPQVSRRPVVGSGAGPRARHFHVDPELRHRGETVALQTSARAASNSGVLQSELDRRLAPQQKSALPELIQKNLLPISAMVLVVGVLGLGHYGLEQLRASGLFAGQSTYSTAGNADADTVQDGSDGRGGPEAFAVALRHNGEFASRQSGRLHSPAAANLRASRIARRDFSFFQPRDPRRRASRDRLCKLPLRRAAPAPTPQPHSSRQRTLGHQHRSETAPTRVCRADRRTPDCASPAPQDPNRAFPLPRPQPIRPPLLDLRDRAVAHN